MQREETNQQKHKENAIKKRKKRCGFKRAKLGFPYKGRGRWEWRKELRKEFRKFLCVSFWLRGDSCSFCEWREDFGNRDEMDERREEEAAFDEKVTRLWLSLCLRTVFGCVKHHLPLTSAHVIPTQSTFSIVFSSLAVYALRRSTKEFHWLVECIAWTGVYCDPDANNLRIECCLTLDNPRDV